MADWKESLNLPRTDFPMKANLQAAEPEAIARWDGMGLYERLRHTRNGRPKFVLHDGPPYANGHTHIGHALNKILKDFVVRAHSMAGDDAPYVPGWDCHGLPIEHNVDKELGKKKRDMSVADFRRACRSYAERFVEVQREEFKRLLVLGDWTQPYLTMRFPYQAQIVRALGRFVAQGMVYKGKKPVHWCINCRTALAEAEVEYESHTSPSIYVEFPLSASGIDELRTRAPELDLAGRDVSVLIWTTTPWTIPSNLAVAFHPELAYGVFEVDAVEAPGDGATGRPRVVILAADLATRVADATGRSLGHRLGTVPGRLLEGLRFSHPLYARDSVGVLADYVTLEQGTGAVHTAPGHGTDDFATGLRYGLEVYAPVGANGRFLDSVELFGGLKVFDANPRVEAALQERGTLWHSASFAHAYPHCWRCRRPVIFLATSQWFVSMERNDLRARAVRDVAGVSWFPAWGEQRMRGMLESRPDWCISRQRAWGVPIPAVNCTACGEAVITEGIVDRAATAFEQYGAEAWYERDIQEFLPEGFVCPSCGATAFEQERDILDVWFDSGSSHEAVLGVRPELTWPADMYLEGTDQYRGWFQSSLLVGLGTRGHAPYRQVLTHGFVVDEAGHKMSKSRGNTVAPQDVIAESGAEVLRLWAASVNYQEEVRIGPEVLARIVEAYRKIRNTARILLANLYDFVPGRDTVAPERLEELDRFVLGRYAEVARRCRSGYGLPEPAEPLEYDYAAVFHVLNRFVTVDLSAFYIDVSKDRLYTLAPGDPVRRSAQTAIHVMADGLARLLAPILPVTAEEIWRHLPPSRETREESVHEALLPSTESLAAWQDPELADRWSRLLKIREAVNAAVEVKRQDKLVGTSLGAAVRIGASGEGLALLERYRAELPTLFIVSAVHVQPTPANETRSAEAQPAEPLALDVTVAEGVRCDRCWRVVPRVSRPATAPAEAGGAADNGICERCQGALAAPVGS